MNHKNREDLLRRLLAGEAPGEPMPEMLSPEAMDLYVQHCEAVAREALPGDQLAQAMERGLAALRAQRAGAAPRTGRRFHWAKDLVAFIVGLMRDACSPPEAVPSYGSYGSNEVAAGPLSVTVHPAQGRPFKVEAEALDLRLLEAGRLIARLRVPEPARLAGAWQAQWTVRDPAKESRTWTLEARSPVQVAAPQATTLELTIDSPFPGHEEGDGMDVERPGVPFPAECLELDLFAAET